MIKKVFKPIIFSICIIFVFKFFEILAGKKLIFEYTVQIVSLFCLKSILFNTILFPIKKSSIFNLKKYYLYSISKFLLTIFYFMFLLKKTPYDNTHVLLSLIITYLLFTSFEVCIILFKLHDSGYCKK